MPEAGVLFDVNWMCNAHAVFCNRNFRNGVADTGLWTWEDRNAVYFRAGTPQCIALHGLGAYNIGALFIWKRYEMVSLFDYFCDQYRLFWSYGFKNKLFGDGHYDSAGIFDVGEMFS